MSTSTVSSPKKNGSRNSQAKWDDETTRILLEVFESEIDRRNRPAGVFSKTGWMNIVLKFKERTGLDYNKDQLKNRQDNLRREFSKWERLIGRETGLGWDHNKRTLSAPDSWWIEKAKSDPTILRYKDGGPVHLDLMQKIFGGITATGYRQFIPEIDESDPLLHTGYEINNLDDIIDFTADAGSHPIESTNPETQANADVGNANPISTPTVSKLASRKKRKHLSTDRLSEADKFSKGMESFTVTMKENMNAYTSAKIAEEEAYQESLSVLKTLPRMGPTNPIFLKGVRVLEDRMKRVAFKSMLDFGPEGVEAWLSTFPEVMR